MIYKIKFKTHAKKIKLKKFKKNIKQILKNFIKFY